MSGWLTTNLVSSHQIPSQQDSLGGRHRISINNTAVAQRLTSTYYWAAPEAYLGNKVRPSRAKLSEHVKKNLSWLFK